MFRINTINIMGLSYFKLIFIFHILFVAGLFLYLGIYRENVIPSIYNILIVIAAIIILYHSYRIASKGLKEPSTNYAHILVIAPLLLYTGYKKTATPKIVYDVYLMLAFAAFGYNTYELYKF
jgi:hypothetical protein